MKLYPLDTYIHSSPYEYHKRGKKEQKGEFANWYWDFKDQGYCG